MQLSLFDIKPVEVSPIKPGKPHRDVSIQPNGDVLYKINFGWMSGYELAVEYGYKGNRYNSAGEIV